MNVTVKAPLEPSNEDIFNTIDSGSILKFDSGSGIQ